MTSPSKAKQLKKIRALMDEYDDALCNREHGDVAANHVVQGLRTVLGLPGFERRRDPPGAAYGPSVHRPPRV